MIRQNRRDVKGILAWRVVISLSVAGLFHPSHDPLSEGWVGQLTEQIEGPKVAVDIAMRPSFTPISQRSALSVDRPVERWICVSSAVCSPAQVRSCVMHAPLRVQAPTSTSQSQRPDLSVLSPLRTERGQQAKRVPHTSAGQDRNRAAECRTQRTKSPGR